jgi:hypothetical protein
MFDHDKISVKTVMNWKSRANNITNVPEGLDSADIS